jgi:ABC-type transport system substrate-binding protein
MIGAVKPKRLVSSAVALLAGTALLGVFGGGLPTASAASSSTPQKGGTLTVLEQAGAIGDWPQGLTPWNNSLSAEDEPMEDAIYGQLFTQDAKGHPQPDLATGYKFLDGGKTVELFLRHGVKFTDGTPFNAQAVAYNIQQDLNPANACICDTSFPVATPLTSNIVAQGPYTVVMHLKEPFYPIITAFSQISSPNWIASPTAYQKMGAKAFAANPVGAGPFEVVKDTFNTELVLKANPNYWQKGHPYLDGVTFKTIGTPESEYEALQSNQGQVAQQIATLSVIQAAEKNKNVRVVTTPGSGTFSLQLNTSTAPFNNIKAREAIYYAINQAALNKVVTGGMGAVSETGDGPASLYPILKIPGYRTYNPTKAKQLVQQLGGLNFGIIGTAQFMVPEEALASEFENVGMKVTITTDTLEQEVSAFQHNSWSAIPGGAGGLDPELGAGGLAWRVQSTGPFTGIHNSYLDQLVNQGVSTPNHDARTSIYTKLYKYLNTNALMPFTYSSPLWNIVNPKAQGGGLSQGMANSYLIQWPSIYLNK